MDSGEIRFNHRFAITLAGLLAALCVAGALMALPRARVTAQEPPAEPAESNCVVSGVGHADPITLTLGERSEISLTLTATCPFANPAAHVVLLADATLDTGSMNLLRTTVASKAREIAASTNEAVRVSIVQFGSTARRLCALESDPERAESCAARIRPSSDPNISAGIRESVSILRRARNDLEEDQDVLEGIILWTAGQDPSCASAAREAQKAIDQGILFRARCLGADCETRCLDEIPDSEGFIEQQLPEEIDAPRFNDLHITATLPTTVRYVTGSAKPQASWNSDERSLSWRLTRNQTSHTVSALIEPLAAGRLLAIEQVTAWFRDTLGREGRYALDELPEIDVGMPEITPTPVRPTSTATAQPSPTPSASPTRLPEPTTAIPETPTPLYLPVLRADRRP